MQMDPRKRIMKRKEKKREFKVHWKEMSSWLEHDAIEDVMFCKVCGEYPKLADTRSRLNKGTGGTGKYRI